MARPETFTGRSLFAVLAAVYFLWGALFFMGPGVSVENVLTDENGNAIETALVGEDAALAVTGAVRAIAGGLVLLSLVGFEWRALAAALRTMETREPEDIEAAPAATTAG